MQALDSGIPPLSDVSTVTITVNRNLNAPKFKQTEYSAIILETINLGDVIARVEADDADRTVSYVQYFSYYKSENYMVL